MDGFDDDPPRSFSRKILKTPRRSFRGDWEAAADSASWESWEGGFDGPKTRRRPSTGRLKHACSHVAVNQSRAARDASSFSWVFARSLRSVCDVDTVTYPYELVRKTRLPDDVIHREEEKYQRKCFPLWQQQWKLDGQQQWGTAPQQQPSHETSWFLERFDSDYIRSAAGFLDGLPTKGSVTVRACFGRTFFRLHAVPSSCVYQFNDLNAISYPRDLRSSWSNVCNDGAPAMRALIGELKLAESGANLEVSRLKLTMRCCLASKGGRQYAKLTYFHENGRWVFAEARALLDVYASHDISLDNSVEFRVKTYAESYTRGRAWWGSIQELVLLDETNGDPLTTTASLVSSTRDDLRIEFVVIKRVSGSANFRGLCFQLAEKEGCTYLQALLPEPMLVEKGTGKRFEFLVSRLVEILDDLSGL